MDSIYKQGGKIQYAGKYLADEEIEEAIEWISSNSNDFIIIIDDKSISTVVGIIAATCAKRSIMILESRLARKSLLEISREYKPKLIIGRDNELKQIIMRTLRKLENGCMW